MYFKYNAAHSSALRFSSGWNENEYYRGSGVHAFSVWEENPLCEYIDKNGNLTKGCNGMAAATNPTPCGMKFMTQEAGVYGQPGHMGKAHHPTSGMHMLRGEMLAWTYGKAIPASYKSLGYFLISLHNDIAQWRSHTARCYFHA